MTGCSAEGYIESFEAFHFKRNLQHLLILYNDSLGWVKKKKKGKGNIHGVFNISLFIYSVIYIIYAHKGLSPLWHSSSPVRREIISHWWLLHLTYASTSEKINANRKIKSFVFFSRGEGIYHRDIGIYLNQIQMISSE